MKTGHVVIGLAAALGVSTLAATPGLSQEVYVRDVQPAPGVVVVEEPYAMPRGQVIVREAPAPVIVREAPQRVIVTEPAPAPMPREVLVRREMAPPAMVMDEGYGCRTLERQSISGITTVSTVCN